MSVADSFATAAGCFVIAAMLLVPGFLIVRLLGVRAGADLWFAGSCVLWLNLLLGMRVIGLPCHPVNVFMSFFGLIGVLVFVLWQSRRDARLSFVVTRWFAGHDWLWGLPVAIGCAAVAYRAVVDPLSGFDHPFRWDYVARYLFATGGWPGFPAATPQDFMTYGWPDAMPPTAALLNFACYLPWAKPSPAATAVRLIVEIVVLMESVAGLAGTVGGRRASFAAAALASTSAILLWAVAMGQETGLTAIGMTAMLRYLLVARDRNDYVAAALASSLGALAREYGLAWPLLGLVVMAVRGDLQRGGLPFMLTAAAAAGPWYMFAWIHTGSPLWPHSVGGLLPTNEAFAYVMGRIAAANAPWSDTAGFLRSGVALVPGAGVVVAVAVAGLCMSWSRVWPLAAAVAVSTGLWFISIAQTAGGPFYAMRVLSPAIAVSAAIGGVALARAGGRFRAAAIAVITVLACEAGVRSWQLPVNAYPSWGDYYSGEWRVRGLGNRLFWQRPEWDELGARCEGWTCLVDHPGVQATLIQRGYPATVVFNPVCEDLFRANVSLRDGCDMLRSRRIGFVHLGSENAMTRQMCEDISFFRELVARGRPVGEVLGGTLFDIREDP